MISCFKQKPADLADLWKLTDYRRFLKKKLFKMSRKVTHTLTR